MTPLAADAERRRRLVPGAGDLAGGLSGGITSIPGNIAVGFVALSPLGAGAQGGGIEVALLAAAVGGGLFTLLCRTRGLMAGGSMSFALVVAGVLATLVHRGVLHAGPESFPAALAVIALLTLLTGSCEAALAASGLGRLVTMLPYPVVSGIRNGVALLMILLQLRSMLGLSWADGTLHWVHPAAVAVSAVTLALMLRPVRALRRIPPAVVGVLAGTAAHYLLAAVLVPRTGGWPLSPLLQVPAGGMQHLRALGAGWAAMPNLPPWTLAVTLVPAALTIAVVSTLETLVGASVMQDISGEHGSSRADLMALAVSNLGGGLCGTLPVTGGSPGSMAVWSAGGRGKAAGWVRAAVLLATVLLAGPVIGLLPTAALAGMVASNGLQVLDRELLLLGRRALSPGAVGRRGMASDLLVSLVVIGTAMAVSLVAAVLIGLLLSAALFVAAMSGRVVRQRYRNPGGRSRMVRPDAETRALLRHGGEIEVIELQGALFFGSADRLVREVEAAWAGGARCVILDVGRVSQVDLSGARRILQMAVRVWRTGAFLAFAGLRPGSPVWTCCETFGLRTQLRTDRVFPSAAEALAAAEQAVLAAHGVGCGGASMTGTQALTRLGIAPDDAGALLSYAREHAFPPGSTIIRMGEPAGTVYVLLEGEVEVSLPGRDELGARLATLTAGTLFGEMALLSGAPRSADVVALTAVRCMGLDVTILDRLRVARPELAYQLMSAIAGQLARNLTMANVALGLVAE